MRHSGGAESFGLLSHCPVWALPLLWKLSEWCLSQADVSGVSVRARMCPCEKDNR